MRTALDNRVRQGLQRLRPLGCLTGLHRPPTGFRLTARGASKPSLRQPAPIAADSLRVNAQRLSSASASPETAMQQKTDYQMLKLDRYEHCLHPMKHSRSGVIRKTPRKLERKGLAMRLYWIVQRLKRLGADIMNEAMLLLLDLFDLKQSSERRVSYVRIRGTDGRFKNKQRNGL